MHDKYKILIKDTALFAVGSLGSKLILFFLVPLYTNYLTTEEYGISELVSTFSQIIMPLSTLVIANALVRFGMMKTEKQENVVLIALLVSVISIFFVLALIPVLGLYRPIREWRLYLVIQVILSNFSEVEKSYLKVKNRNGLFSLISILQTTVLASMNIYFLVFMHLGIRGYLTSNIVATGVVVLVSFFAGDLHKDLFIATFDRSLLKRMISFSGPLVLSNISWWVIHSSDKVMIEWLVSASALGLYTVASKIPSLINVIIAIFNQAWGLSSIREIETTKDLSFYSDVFSKFTTVLFACCLIINSFIKPFISIYVGDDFEQSWRYVPLLLVAAVYFSISAFLGSIYSALQKTTNDMWTNIICAFINLIINVVLIQRIGVWGAVIGTVGSFLFIVIIRLIDIHKLINMVIPKELFFNSCLIFIQAILLSFDIRNIYISLLLLLLFFFINQRAILTLIYPPRELN